jgi:hypothetical protein
MKHRALTEKQAEEIRELSKTMRNIDIARMYRVSPQLVSTIVLHGYGNRPKPKDKSEITPYRTWEEVAMLYTERNPHDPITAKEARDMYSRMKYRLERAFRSAGLNESSLV